MSRPEAERARGFLQRADADLAAVRALVALDEVPDEFAGFHGQQAAEKLLKAVLAAHGIDFPARTRSAFCSTCSTAAASLHLRSSMASSSSTPSASSSGTKRGGRRRDARIGRVARRDDDVARLPRAGVRLDGERRPRPLHRSHRGMLVHGRADHVGVAAQVIDEGGAAEIAARVGMRCAAIQPVEPVGREQVERVPAFPAPALADPAPVEDGVPVAGAGEVPAQRQPCLTGADDERFGLPHGTHDRWRLGWRPAATSPRSA